MLKYNNYYNLQNKINLSHLRLLKTTKYKGQLLLLDIQLNYYLSKSKAWHNKIIYSTISSKSKCNTIDVDTNILGILIK